MFEELGEKLENMQQVELKNPLLPKHDRGALATMYNEVKKKI